MFVDKWSKMPEAKQKRFEIKLRRAARRFYYAKNGVPHLSTLFIYYMSKFILKKYVGADGYPYIYWNENGYFDKRPL